MKNKRVLKLTESAIMVALATVLSLITVMRMPFDGTVTACSLVPISVIAYRYGVKWGSLVGVVYGLIQMLIGFSLSLSYATGLSAALAIIFFDYVFAFGAFGLVGMFKDRISNQGLSMALGVAVACAVRFICHFLSGITVWSGFAQDMPAWLYSLSYNGFYMLPETVVTVLGVLVLSVFLNFSTLSITAMYKKRA